MTDLFLKDIRLLSKLPVKRAYANLQLFEYPFDLQLLSMSRLYRESRAQYLDLGGRFSPRLSSTLRSLSAQDLFADEIDYTPAATELEWFAANVADVYHPDEEVTALEHFNTVSVFHEQNHRLLWRLLPDAPRDERGLIRYLNFAESLVVMLDLALADEVGSRYALAFERMKVIYRVGSPPASVRKNNSKHGREYRTYLVSCLFATYLLLELTNPEDILNAVNYVRPNARAVNRAAVTRALDMNELFTRITNPQWQEREWKRAAKSIQKMRKGGGVLSLPADPLDFDSEIFALADFVLESFGL